MLYDTSSTPYEFVPSLCLFITRRKGGITIVSFALVTLCKNTCRSEDGVPRNRLIRLAYLTSGVYAMSIYNCSTRYRHHLKQLVAHRSCVDCRHSAVPEQAGEGGVGKEVFDNNTSWPPRSKLTGSSVWCVCQKNLWQGVAKCNNCMGSWHKFTRLRGVSDAKRVEIGLEQPNFSASRKASPA